MTTRLTRKQLLQVALVTSTGQLLSTLGCGDDTSEASAGAGASGPSSSSNGGGGSTGIGGDGGGTSQGGGPGAGGSGTGGSAQGGAGGGGDACSALITAQISLNHPAPHALEIPLADILAGVETTYQTGGSSTHCHQVTLTASDFATLRNGGSVSKVSCNGGDHMYVLSCAPGAPAPTNPMCGAGDNTGSC